MHAVRVTVTRYVDDGYPPWVEADLREADGTVVTLHEKVPVIDDGDTLVPGVELPVEIEVPCDIVEDGAGSVLVRLHWNIEDTTGRDTFRVDRGTLVVRGNRVAD